MLLGILLTVQIIISVIIIALVLVQRSEGGALGMGGGPSGFMSARGAGNLLTRATGIMAVLFFVNCIAMTIVGNYATRPTSAVDSVDTSGLLLPTAPNAGSAQAPAQATSSAAPSLNDLPLGGATPAPVAQQPASRAAPPQQQRPAALPAPLSATGTSASRDASTARAGIWNNASSSAAPASAPASTPQP